MIAAPQDSQRQSDLREIFRAAFERIDEHMAIQLAAFKTEIVRWMFVFWMGQMAITVALFFAPLKLVK